MKVLLVFASYVAVTYGGVLPWSPEAESEALNLFRRYCGSGRDNGNDGPLFWYCKSTTETNEENVDHNIVLTAPPDSPKQVVFIQPPPVKYNHNVVVTGESGGQQKTNIYVLPAKAEHSLTHTDERGQSAKPEKPSLFFLKGNPEESPNSQPEQPPQPGYRY